MKYLGNRNIYYNDSQIQNDPPICGYLSVYVLKKLRKGEELNKQLIN